MAGNISVSVDRARLAARMRAGKEHCGKFLAEQILGDCNLYSTPNESVDVGLAESGRVEKIGDDYAATWNTVYAAAHYYGVWEDGTHRINDANRSREVVPRPSTQWAEVAKEQYGDDWEKVAQREFVKGSEI